MRSLRGRKRAQALRELVHRLAAHELHHHQQIVVVPVELVERRDARVIEARERDGLGTESLEDVRVAEIGVEDLDGNFTIERFVDRFVHGPHAAPAEAFDDSILSDGFTNHGTGAEKRSFEVLKSRCAPRRLSNFGRTEQPHNRKPYRSGS